MARFLYFPGKDGWLDSVPATVFSVFSLSTICLSADIPIRTTE